MMGFLFNAIQQTQFADGDVDISPLEVEKDLIQPDDAASVVSFPRNLLQVVRCSCCVPSDDVNGDNIEVNYLLLTFNVRQELISTFSC